MQQGHTTSIHQSTSASRVTKEDFEHAAHFLITLPIHIMKIPLRAAQAAGMLIADSTRAAKASLS